MLYYTWCHASKDPVKRAGFGDSEKFLQRCIPQAWPAARAIMKLNIVIRRFKWERSWIPLGFTTSALSFQHAWNSKLHALHVGYSKLIGVGKKKGVGEQQHQFCATYHGNWSPVLFHGRQLNQESICSRPHLKVHRIVELGNVLLMWAWANQLGGIIASTGSHSRMKCTLRETLRANRGVYHKSSTVVLLWPPSVQWIILAIR